MVKALLVNTDGTICVSGGCDGIVLVWDLRKRAVLQRFEVHEESVWALVADKEFKRIFSGGRDNAVFEMSMEEMCDPKLLFRCNRSVLSLAHGNRGDNEGLWTSSLDGVHYWVSKKRR